MKSLKVLLLALVLTVFVFAMAGCSGDAVEEAAEVNVAEGEEAVEEVAEEVEEETAEEAEKIVITSLVQPTDNPWVVNNVRFQEAVADALGIELRVVSDEGTEDSNIAAMQGLVALQPDGILFDPITQPAGVRDATLLEENEIPGCTEDRLVLDDIEDYEGDYLVCAVTQDNTHWGYQMMMSLIDQGATKIVAIMDPKGVITVEEAWEGALQAVEDNPGVTILQESWQPKSRENAIDTMERYLAKYGPGEVDGVFAFGSTVGLGAWYAIEQAGRQDEIVLSTCDIDYDVLTAIKNGQLTSSIGAHWMNGGFALIMLYDYLNGFEPLDPQPEFRMISVTAENADKYQETFLDGLPYTAEEIRQLSRVHNPDADLPEAITTLWSTWDQ